ncbi:FAD/NAD(P)-binding domain-containing protein [Favolaschia claudopus]|uniref:FAD/NAD(P)-binding domain-containing protein n=1 Tax=Favolaschia claudopus TaxID=2862362 RepID=A0AAW0CVG5_9AGAR
MTTNAPSTPLNVSVVGAGIAGLAVATALRRNGHRVQVRMLFATYLLSRDNIVLKIFESAEVKVEIGAAIVVPRNAQLVLEHLGYNKDNLRSVDFVGIETFNALGDAKTRMTAPWIEIDGKVAIMCVRSDLHGELERLATGPGEGPPAVMHLASQVVDCNTQEGFLKLSDGRVIQSDLVLGADGISSTIRTHILGYRQSSLRTGLTNCRTLMDVAKLDAEPELSWVREGVSGPRSVMTFGAPPDEYRWLFLYPCRSGTLLNFIAILNDPNQDEPGWNPIMTRADLLSKFSAYPPHFAKLLTMLPEKLPRWQLRYMPELPTWVNGHAALLGDAAHATLPTLGQGAAQAMEDAAALGVLLPLGTTRGDIPERLKVYQALRKERTERIARESHDQMIVPAERGKYLRDFELQKYVMGYNVLEAARAIFEQKFQVN